MMAPGTAVRVERPLPHVALVELDRPPVNALDRAAQRELAAALSALDEDHDVRCVVLAGAGRAFCAGADLREEQSLARDDVGHLLADVGRMLAAVEHHRVPVVAAVHGAAHGGGLELALACHLRVAGHDASFGAAGVNVGLVASFWSLTQVVGVARARHLLLTGAPCDAARALAWGLVTAVADDPRAEALRLAERIASRSPLAVEATAACLHQVAHLDRREATQLQVETFARLFRTDDHREALRAFFERRPGTYHRR